MSKLSFNDFMKLSEKEKCKRYKDLSDYDKFLARINQPIKPLPIINEELTEEQREKNKQLTEEEKKNLEEMEKFAERHIAKLKEMRKEKEK